MDEIIIGKLNKVTVKNFAAFIPMDLTKHLKKSEYAFIGAGITTPEGLLPVGSAVCRVKDSKTERILCLEWLLVDPEYRNRGVADELMQAVYGLANETEADYIQVVLKGDFAKGKVFQNLRSFFADYNFILVGAKKDKSEVYLGSEPYEYIEKDYFPDRWLEPEMEIREAGFVE